MGAYFFSGKVLSLQVFFRLIFDSVKNFGGGGSNRVPPPLDTALCLVLGGSEKTKGFGVKCQGMLMDMLS